jgi:D-alanine--poly(phosphoribitol) ligase subunit 1
MDLNPGNPVQFETPNVLQGILEQTRIGPDRLAVKDQHRSLTYGELRDEVAKLASGLAEYGVTEGDRIALFLPNSIEFVVAALASLWIGAIFVPLAVTDPEARLATMLADCSPTIVLSANNELSEPSGAASIEEFPFVAMSTLTNIDSASVEPVDSSPRRAYSMYTSGTTGTPKGVLIGTVAFGAAVEAITRAVGLDEKTRTLCVSPFYFDGSYANLFPTLFAGGLVIIHPFSLLFSRTFFDTVINERVTYTGFTPSFLRLLLANRQMTKLADSTLDVIGLGGEACSITDIRTLWSFAPKIRVFNRYGPTETTIVVTDQLVTPELIADGTMPIGRPHPFVTFHLVDEDGDLIEGSDRVGELYIGGVQVMDGYWGAPELTEKVLRSDLVPEETLYRTGDLVYRDAKGNYVYVDRADRVINRGGLRISLVELSEAMRRLSAVSAAACVTFDDSGDLGIVAFVVTDGTLSTLDLRKSAEELLPDSMLPNRIEIVEALPLNKSNKLDERRLLSEAGLIPLRPGTAPGRHEVDPGN